MHPAQKLMKARILLKADAAEGGEGLPVWIKLPSRSRSAALSFTTYFFAAISLAATNRLRQNVAVPSIRRFYSLSMTGGY
jgi:hypothetical protein